MTCKEGIRDVTESLEGRLVLSTFLILVITLFLAGLITAREIDTTVRDEISQRARTSARLRRFDFRSRAARTDRS